MTVSWYFWCIFDLLFDVRSSELQNYILFLQFAGSWSAMTDCLRPFLIVVLLTYRFIFAINSSLAFNFRGALDQANHQLGVRDNLG